MLIFSSNGQNNDIKIVPDFYELRLDLASKHYYVPIFYYTRKTIITLRNSNEGGMFNGQKSEKIDFYIKILNETDFYIDIELDDILLLYEKIDINMRQRLIISIHESSNNNIKLFNLVKENHFIYDCFFYKIVIMNSSFLDYFALYNNLEQLGIKYTLLSSGSTLHFSRILYKQLGFTATYFGKKGFETSPGQLVEEDVLKFNILNLNNDTSIGGIIGGKQILSSLGLTFYNNYFQNNNKNAVYLPFIIDNTFELDFFLNKITSKKQNVKEKRLHNWDNFNFYGFSITMPYKEEITKLLKIDNKIINLWVPKLNKIYMTDEDAFIKSFIKLQISQKTIIIIIGSGAMAKTALKILSNNKIYMINRNTISKKNIVNEQRCIDENNSTFNTYISKINQNIDTNSSCSELNYKFKDTNNICIINTTPIGMNMENFLEVFPLSNFDKVIDLPYTYSNKTTPLTQFCIDNNIPVVDGIEFWYYQAKQQLEIFLSQIEKLK